MGVWDSVKNFVTRNDDEDEVSPKTRAIQMIATDNVGKPRITTKDVYRQRHNMKKKRKKGAYYDTSA
jgi:hypothetical protein